MEKTTFVLASHNAHKLKEVQEILTPLNIEIINSREANLSDVEETGETFAQNALLKAVAGVKEAKRPVIADDSGLCIEALDNAPGVYSARFAAKHGGYPAVFDVINEQIGNNPNRRAFYVCSLALAFSPTEVYMFEGRMYGTIAKAPEGTQGFGYDPIFIPDGFTQTLGNISAEDKNKISHRGKALAQLHAFLEKRQAK